MFDGLHKLSLPLEYRIKNRVRVNYFKITSSLVSYCDSVTILKPFIASNIFFFSGGEGGEERLFSVMPEIFYQLLWRQGGQVVWIPHLKSGGPGNKPSLAVSQLRPASGQLGFYTP